MDDLADLIKTGRNDVLENHLTKNPDAANGRTAQGISLLQYAAYFRNRETIEIIMRFKKELDIFESATIGDEPSVTSWLQSRAELVNGFSSDGFTPLGLAAYFGHLEVAKLLLDHQADPNIAASNQMRVAPLHSACAVSNYEIVALLIRAGADVNAKQMHGVTPLHSAAHNGQTHLAKLLIDSGAEINVRSEQGQTPLDMAEEKDHKETAALLRSLGAMTG